MFGLGWGELLVVGLVALIIVGPRDLPVMFRQLGKFSARARAMAREFRQTLDHAADQAGVKDLQNDLQSLSSGDNLGLEDLEDLKSDWTDFDTDNLDADRKDAANKIHQATAAREDSKKQTKPATAKASSRSSSGASSRVGPAKTKTLAPQSDGGKRAKQVTKKTGAKANPAGKTTGTKTGKATSKAAPKSATAKAATKTTAKTAPKRATAKADKIPSAPAKAAKKASAKDI